MEFNTKNQRNKIKFFLIFTALGLVCAFLLNKAIYFNNIVVPLSAKTGFTSTVSNFSCPQEMLPIKGGTFRIGSDRHYREERSAENVTVDSFCIDKYEVTNAQFQQFVQETDYLTVAERPLSAEAFPHLSQAQRLPGSVVFVPPTKEQAIGKMQWWQWIQGADWRHPQGSSSTIKDKDNYPVVQIAFEDAQAYAKWAGKSLPTEAQWEFAAKGGLKSAIFTWGNKYSPKKANTWQGVFPLQNTHKDGYLGTAPVGSYPANGYGLYDMAGNVWEWTLDWYSPGHQEKVHQVNPLASNKNESYDPREPGIAKHVIKGGSYLCSPNYCSRYRPSARESQAPDTGTSHIGFRLVKSSSKSTDS